MMTLKMTMTKKMRCTELSRSPWPEAARANLLFAETIMIVMTIIMIVMTTIMITIMVVNSSSPTLPSLSYSLASSA